MDTFNGEAPLSWLRGVRGLATANRIVLTAHASQRMRTRRVQYGDVRHALTNAHRGRHAGEARWRVEGPDLDGDELTVVVTVF